MSAAYALLERLHGLGFEVEPDPPAIVVTYRGGPSPPAEARPLLDELRERKREVLAVLSVTPTQPWDDTWERARLAAAVEWCDKEARLNGTCWAECWSFASEFRPRLVADMDAALDAIDATHRARDVATHTAACDRLRRAVGAIVNARAANRSR